MMRDTAGLFEKGFSANAFNSGKLYFGIRQSNKNSPFSKYSPLFKVPAEVLTFGISKLFSEEQ